MQKLNLETVGKLAGVSRSTVSRVLNGEPNVSPEARARVEAVIRETGYQPNAAARSLASSRSGFVGLVIPSAVESLFDDPYFGRLILGISSATNDLGLALSLFLFSHESDEHGIHARIVNRSLMDGVIVTATQMGDPLIGKLIEAGMPFVVVGRPDDETRVASVDADNRGGARSAALHLAGLGYQRIGMISAPSNSTAGVDRRAGFLEGLAVANLTIDDRIAEGNWTEASGRAAMLRLIELRPDAVFVASDRMAVGALGAIREAGLTCPRDIGVVSFDGIIPPSQTVPRLTSVAQPVAEVGQRAVRLLSTLIDGLEEPPPSIVLPTELVIRESCGAQRREVATP